jgi:hypothetical protein
MSERGGTRMHTPPGGGHGASAAAEFFVVLWVGFLVLLMMVPEAARRGIETEHGVWLSGVNVGLILGMGLIVAGMVLAAVNALHAE